jgi:hypothetical protein
MTENTLLDDLASALDALSRHLARENEILAKHDASELQALFAEKERLAGHYASLMTALKKEPALAKEAPDGLRNRLREAGERFQAVMGEHSRRVVSLKKVTEGIVKAVCDEVDSRNRPLKAYSATKATAPRRSVNPTSIAFNERA